MSQAFSRVSAAAVVFSIGLGFAAPAHAVDPERAGDWILRARALGVLPHENSTISGIGGTAHADDTVVPEFNITYFATDHIAFELIAAVTKHDVEARATSLGRVDLGDAWLLPPTLTVQYHWTTEGRTSPYLGVGLNYTHIFDADAPGTTVKAISYSDSFGPALQAGVDIWLDEQWSFNVDVKKLWLNTDVSINTGAIKADVDLNPWLVGVGLGYKF